ncbi:repeat element protein-b11 [Ichnoviriform fugitivi]|uniref:Repeat element protein-b11 n=1 Tax=Ichnoviriform fugitivi TaxID=265522 RepID=Q6PYS9_9VIRU|nr:repeat element protein-b11 [Ichnoviriform fugitivi]AAS83460.1 repeat element protein-b11 [Ichnoviriform fugitivi]
MGGRFRAFMTSLRKWISSSKTSQKASISPPCCDVVLYMSQFMPFEDFQNLVEAFWPNGGEDELIRQHLWKLSTRKYVTKFFNGKSLEVVYNYNTKRSKKDRILLNVKTLLPITGPIFPADTDVDELWMSPLELHDIVVTRFDMDKCWEYRYANCDCCERLHHTVEYPETFAEFCDIDCPYGHFHHYCVHHVSWWLMSYLHTSIQVQERRLAQPTPVPRSRRSFGYMLLRCWCIPAGAESRIVSDVFTSGSGVNDIGNLANL